MAGGKILQPINKLNCDKIQPIYKSSIRSLLTSAAYRSICSPEIIHKPLESHTNHTRSTPINSLRFLSSEINRPPCIPFFLLIR